MLDDVTAWQFKDVSTTMIYTHVMNKGGRALRLRIYSDAFRQFRGRTYRLSLQALLRPPRSSPLDRAEQPVAEYRAA